MADQVNEESAVVSMIEFIDRSVRAEMMDLLQDHDWIERIRTKCRAYIQQNGTKIISVDEIVDYLKEDALNNFPKNVKDKCRDSMYEILKDIRLM